MGLKTLEWLKLSAGSGSPSLRDLIHTVALSASPLNTFRSGTPSIGLAHSNTLPTLLRLSFVDHVPPLRLTWGAGNQKDFKVEESEKLIGSHETVFSLRSPPKTPTLNLFPITTVFNGQTFRF